MTLILTPAARPLTEIRPSDRRAAPAGQRRGVLVSRAYEGGPEQHVDIVQCCHCQMAFPYVRGSGTVRGWCLRCNGITCGPGCDECVPAEQLLANMAAGMPFHRARRHRPVKAAVPCKVPRSKGGILLGRG